MKARAASKAIAFALGLALLAPALSGCLETRPTLVPESTLPVPTAQVTETPQASATPTAPPITPSAAPAYDLNGKHISGVTHFEQYLLLRNVQVYEQEEDTFVDAIVRNDYPETIVCAAVAAFYDETGELVAQGRLQTRDAQYVLVLPPGETTLFAQVDTDMALTDLTFSILFDEELGVQPETQGK